MNTFFAVCLVGFACNITVFVATLYSIYKEDKEIELGLVALLLFTCCIPWALYFLYLVAVMAR